MPPKAKKGGGKGKKGKKGGAQKGEDAADAAFQDYLNDMFLVGPETQLARQLAIRRKLREVFQVVQGEREGLCDIHELGSIVRAMGLNPSVAQLKIIQGMVEDPDTANFAVYDKLEPLLVDVLTTKELKHMVTGPDGLPMKQVDLMDREPDDVVFRAFLTLWEHGGRKTDQDRSKYIGAEPLRELLTKAGVPSEHFDEQEIQELLQVAADPDTGLVKEELMGIILTEE